MSISGSSNPSSFWLDSTPVIPYLSHSDRISKIGLENGTLYDVLEKNNGEGDVFVNALSFNVTCGYVDGASVKPINNTGNWTVDTIYDEHVQTIAVLGGCLCETDRDAKTHSRIFSAQYIQVAEFLHL